MKQSTKKQSKKFTVGQSWGALRKAWTGFKIAKIQKDRKEMIKYAGRINTLQEDLHLPQTRFKALNE